MSVGHAFQIMGLCGLSGLGMKAEYDDDLGLNSHEPSHNYYHEYCRLYYANVVLTSQMKELFAHKELLKQRLTKLEEEEEDSSNDRLKRHRRPASLISRHFKCDVITCQKSYGSEGSLNQHLKLKHPDIYQELLERSEDPKSKQSF